MKLPTGCDLTIYMQTWCLWLCTLPVNNINNKYIWNLKEADDNFWWVSWETSLCFHGTNNIFNKWCTTSVRSLLIVASYSAFVHEKVSKLHAGVQSRELEGWQLSQQISDTHAQTMITSGGSSKRRRAAGTFKRVSSFQHPKICPVSAKPCKKESHHLSLSRPQETERVGSCHLYFPSLAGWRWRGRGGRGVNYWSCWVIVFLNKKGKEKKKKVTRHAKSLLLMHCWKWEDDGRDMIEITGWVELCHISTVHNNLFYEWQNNKAAVFILNIWFSPCILYTPKLFRKWFL